MTDDALHPKSSEVSGASDARDEQVDPVIPGLFVVAHNQFGSLIVKADNDKEAADLAALYWRTKTGGFLVSKCKKSGAPVKGDPVLRAAPSPGKGGPPGYVYGAQ